MKRKKIRYFCGILLLFLGILMMVHQKTTLLSLKSDSFFQPSFAVYINETMTSHLPKENENLRFDEEKSFCNNGVNINWSYLLWTASINFTNYELQNKERTYCNLYFKTREEYTFDYKGIEQEFVIPQEGYYQVELWGASGGEVSTSSSHGGYVSGILELTSTEHFFIYVGESGKRGEYGTGTTSLGQGASSTFNGGGGGGKPGGSADTPASTYRGGSSGGGATDIRLVNGLWNDFNSLKSRIMVAGAGGGNSNARGADALSGGNNLGLIGERGATTTSHFNKGGQGATQISGFAFGYGQVGDNTGTSSSCNGHSGGGGGYYGGFGGLNSGSDCYTIGGGGGSSFISGHNGCDAIKEESTESNIIHTGEPYHYSGYIFTDTKMIDGMGYAWTDTKQNLEAMPNPSGGYYNLGVGHTGNGYARITYLGK